MKKLISLITGLTLFSFVTVAQVSIQWQKSLGGTGSDGPGVDGADMMMTKQTTDGGFITIGTTNSNNGDVSGNHGGKDMWIIKQDASGNIQWQKAYGGTSDEGGVDIELTPDGGYITVGRTTSNNGDVSGNNGGGDYWVVKINSAGSIQWQKCLGGVGYDSGLTIATTADGGYIVTGAANGGGTNYHLGPPLQTLDVWVFKLNSAGVIEWERAYGGTRNEFSNSIIQTSDGGYAFAALTLSNDGDVSGNHGGHGVSNDYWVVKLGSTGAIQWQKCLGGTGDDNPYELRQTADGGFIVAGFTGSTNGDVTSNSGSYDAWVVKLNSSGNIQWQSSYGASSQDESRSIGITSDGGYILGGYSYSAGTHGNADFWLVKINNSGILQWQKFFGGTNSEFGYSTQQTSDGYYVISGYSNSTDGEVTGNHGNYDIWIAKLGPSASIPTLSEWGLILLSLLSLSLIAAFAFAVRTQRSLVPAGTAVAMTPVAFIRSMPLNGKTMLKVLAVLLPVAVIGFAAVHYFIGTNGWLDFAGTMVSMTIISYVVHLGVIKERT